jgi:hypothetical protein
VMMTSRQRVRRGRLRFVFAVARVSALIVLITVIAVIVVYAG